MINFKDVDICEFIDQIFEIIGEIFVVDLWVKGQVSVVFKVQFLLSEVYQLFFLVMSIYGFIVVVQGDQVCIVFNVEVKIEVGGGQSVLDCLEMWVIQVQQSLVLEFILLICLLVL